MSDGNYSQFEPATDRAGYIEKMTGELSRLANEAGLGMLSYLLEMAREEASLAQSMTSHASDSEPAPDSRPRKRGRPIKFTEQ